MAQVRDGKFAPLRIKLLWTALFFACFLVGRNIPVHLLHQVARTRDQASADVLNAANLASGGNFFSPSLFSLGLGPWMTAAILWRFLFIGRIARDRKIPEDTVKRARSALVVALAVFQAISLMGHYHVGSVSWLPFSDRLNAQIVIVVLLTAGAIVVAWLANKNEDLGIGGITIFILFQIVSAAVRNVEVLSVATRNGTYMRVLWLMIIASVCVLIVGIVAGNREVRLHVNKVSIDSGYTGMSYLPIKYNPAGASPIMYALTLIALPQYIAHVVSALIPGTTSGVDGFLSAWGLSTPLGFTVYLLLLFAMTIFFGLFSVSPKDSAERMQNAGEYFDHIEPGDATRRYLRGRVVQLSALSGVFLVVFTGLPLAFIGSYPSLQYLLLAPGTVMIVVGLVWLLKEEIADTILGTKYEFTFKVRTSKAPSGNTTA